MVKGLRKTKYIINKHSQQVADLIKKHLLPTYMKRLGISPKDQQNKYTEIEAILDPDFPKNSMFEGASYVALDKSNNVVACSMNYFISREKWVKDFVQLNAEIAQNTDYSENQRRYCQQQYEIYHDVIDLIYDKYNLQTILYLEDGITLPEYRGLKISEWFQESVYEEFGKEYGFLADGMMPVDKIRAGKISPAFRAMHNNGFITVKEIRTFDEYMVPVMFRPPQTNNKSKL